MTAYFAVLIVLGADSRGHFSRFEIHVTAAYTSSSFPAVPTRGDERPFICLVIRSSTCFYGRSGRPACGLPELSFEEKNTWCSPVNFSDLILPLDLGGWEIVSSISRVNQPLKIYYMLYAFIGI